MIVFAAKSSCSKDTGLYRHKKQNNTKKIKNKYKSNTAIQKTIAIYDSKWNQLALLKLILVKKKK